MSSWADFSLFLNKCLRLTDYDDNKTVFDSISIGNSTNSSFSRELTTSEQKIANISTGPIGGNMSVVLTLDIGGTATIKSAVANIIVKNSSGEEIYTGTKNLQIRNNQWVGNNYVSFSYPISPHSKYEVYAYYSNPVSITSVTVSRISCGAYFALKPDPDDLLKLEAVTSG